jgi:hypothetical protein
VALIACGAGGRPGYFPNVGELLAAAGAEVVSTTRISTPFEPGTRAGRGELAGLLAASGSEEPLEAAALGVVGEGIATGDSARRLAQLASALGIGLEGEYRLPARRVAVLCDPPDEPPTAAVGAEGAKPLTAETVARVLAERAAAAGAAVVVGETEDAAPFQALRGRVAQGISTVDHVDTAAGQLSLVLALAGARGNWGTKTGATGLLPPLE